MNLLKMELLYGRKYKTKKYRSLQIKSLMQFSAVYFKMNLMFTFLKKALSFQPLANIFSL